MNSLKLKDLTFKATLSVSILVFVLIMGTASLILKDEREAIFDDMGLRTEVLSKRTSTVMFPKLDLFFLHVLVNTFMLEKTIRSASILEQSGRILSHSDPEKIGDLDKTPESTKAIKANSPLRQHSRDASGMDVYYFSAPVTAGDKRLGTALVTVTTASMNYRLAATKEKLLLILIASLLAMVLLAEILALMRKERASAAFKSAMVHLVSHEFNNALTVIDAALFMLKESEPQPSTPSRQGLYRALTSERISLGSYVKNILNEARMEAGKFNIEKKPLALRDIAAKLLETIKPMMLQRKMTVSLEMSEKPMMVSADREAMILVISNLIGNAFKYTPEGGHMGINIVCDDKNPASMTFMVENSGNGISAEDIEKMTGEFYRTEDGRAAASGFGLGLKISNEMLLLHGSRLEIKSELGKNTCFYFSLPVLSVPDSAGRVRLPRSRAGTP
jgi:signal transduction histidine kinase